MRESISVRKAAVLAAVIPMGIALIIAAVFLIAPAAHAAPEMTTAAQATGQPVQFSTDGIHWSDSYTGSLFGGVLLVPGGSAERAFYVRNNAGEPAQLRVTLYDLATTDINLATAMSVSTSTPGYPGASVPVTDARPCTTLSQGQVLAAGDGVRLDNVATLADLNGTVGQTRAVAFKLAISLSSTDSAAPLPNTCPTDFGGTVVGSPDPGAGTTSHPVYHLGAGGWTPDPATASGTVPTPALVEPAPETLVFNTERLYQENIVALWLAMAVLGVLLLVVVRRRRRDDDAFEQYPSFQEPTAQNGTGR
jgi:hypothetical protein